MHASRKARNTSSSRPTSEMFKLSKAFDICKVHTLCTDAMRSVYGDCKKSSGAAPLTPSFGTLRVSLSAGLEENVGACETYLTKQCSQWR